ncbi:MULTISPECIES: LysM peptidoglycan-binding domain-containing protein [unclassified Mesorhizobium]|uniref:LysM peptidoglycan-binding domain-containing protein n=2 Tax=Mesorhizobium TaxID=68287 RepID=UPI000FCAA29E|nr:MULTISPECIES: LysM peptidoglycan-binding domain-containing protein [unclassified Mesorhizobium]RUW74911.1 LysM peptidoglycan-binding domain-containing protein [Mesorhizobium sp. M4B.F.Ca.ET.049.02.1.2]TGV26762.1 LysM peptidoglycan-binding domain-containing protein [Mesorhizobium sp. M4B.F.Ca.ET.143.01.1.1]
MVRPITLTKPPVQPQKVDAKANAAQVARLEAQAAQLREQIRLANRMGERDWAAQARQQLAQVNSELSSLQPPPVAVPAMPGVNVVNASAGTSGNGATVAPALYVRPDLAATAATVKLDGGPAEENPKDATTARNIVNDVTGGKSIDQIASARGMTREQVIAALRSGGMTVSTTDPTSGNGDVQTTKITDGSGRTVTQYYDYQHDSYYTSVQAQPNGAATTTPVRDGLGRKETSSYNPDTGAITTRYEDDLGTGTVTERTSMPNGTSVETVTPGAGPSLPVTTVTGPDGRKTILAASQDPGGASTHNIKQDLADGKSIEQIAQENGLTSDQVVAELQAAGYKVTATSSSDAQSVELADPRTGDKTVYSYDYQHDVRTVTTTADGKKTSQSIDGNGTETKTVTDKDGRVTTTITEKINGGKPVEYEVKPGDNLTLIARKYGVSLDDLRRTNPGLFDSARDPDVINAGEKVTIEDGTRTTVKVTFNGYTLTTRPDGSMTLHNDTTGSDLKIEVGTAQQALAELLMKINPQSKDPEQAKTDTVLKTILEGVLGGASPELAQEVADKQQAVKDAIKQYGGGRPATPNLDGSATSVGPFGEPPSATAPSGGKWVPLMVDGSWQWFDPEVAKAIAAENAVIARLGEAQAKPEQSGAQLDVYALDPEFKGAVKSAETTLDKVLAPYGLQWQAPEPKGTLADAQKRLTTANSMLQSASTARAEYAQGEKSLLDALGKQATLPMLSDPSKPSVGPVGGPSREETNLQGKAEHAGVTQLFINAALHTARGNKATIDQMVSATELELYGVKSGSPEYTEINGRLEGLKGLQGPAASQVTLAEAYEEFGVAQKDAADLAVDVEPIKQALVAQAKQRNPHHFDWDGYTNGEGDFTGKLKSQQVIEENGQLYLVNTYENDVFSDKDGNDTPVLRYALTYDLGDKNIRDDFRNNPLNKQWQELLASTQSSASAPVCTPNGTGSQSALAAAKSKIVGVQVEQFDAKLKDAKAKLVDATTARDKAITEHGGGTVEAPAGTLQPGEKPVKVTVNGRELWVAPEVAAAYEKSGPGAIGASGKSVRIEMDGQWLWVHPEVAAAEIDRGLAETEKTQLETWNKDVRPAMVAARDWYGFYASNPKLLTYGNEEHEARLKNTYFEEHKDQALAGYQVRLKQLYDNGFTGEYKQYKPGELSGTVARTLGLDESSEGVTKVTGEITDRAGENAEVKVVPIFSLDGGMESSTALFAIKNDGKEIGYVDSSGKYYGSFDEFQHENRIFSQNGKLILAKGGDMKLGADGFSLDEVEIADARKVDFWDKATDIGLGIVAGAATIVSFVPGGQWAIPIAITSGAALGGKTLYKEGEHLLQGGDFDSQSAWNVATGVTAFLPVGAGALRTFGLARAGLSTSEAFAGGFGMARMSDASWGIGKLRVNVTQSSYAEQAASYLQSGSKLTNTAWGLDAGGVVTGIPVLARSAEDLARHGGEMSFAELANAIMGIGTGAVGTGLGGRSLLYNMPGASGPRGGDATPTSGFPPPGGPDSGPGPRAVYAMGQDGVYRPTGEYVMPDPNEIVIQGEVIGETSGQPGPGFSAREGAGNPVGQRALPAGKSEGQNQPPSTGDKTDPSGNSQPSRPIVLHEPFEGAGSGDPTMLPGRDPDGLAVRSPANPTDGDPIIVSNKPTVTEVPVHLVWDPETRSFTGTPERDTGGYVYTSGKDPKTPSAYLDGLTTEQLVTRYEQEKSYYSSHELAERYGPDGIPETARRTADESAAPGANPLAGVEPAKQKNWGDFRISALGRVRFNSDPVNMAVHSIPGMPEALQLGSPTWRSYMVGLGTRTDYRALWQAFADSVKYRSLEPARYSLGKELGISIRPNEHRNVTLAQLGLKVQRQTAFQFKGQDLLDAARQRLFGEASDSVFTVMPRSASVEGPAGNKGWAVELTFSLALRSKSAILKDGESDFLRQTADGKTEFSEFHGDVPYRKVYLEDKYYLTSLLSVEKRYEVAMDATLPKGTIVNSDFVDANKGVLDRLRLRAQFVVKDEHTAQALADNPDMSTIRTLVASGEIDAQKSILFIPGSASGMRQSAVPGLALGETIVDLTGKSRRVWDAGASRLEVIVNEAFHKFLPSPDRILLRKLPAPYNHYVRSGGPIYVNLFGKREAVASTLDVTLAVRSPALKLRVPSVPFLQLPLAFTGEIRFFYRTNLPEVAPIVAKGDFVGREFTFADNLPVEIAVPRWLHELDQRADRGGGLAFPRGGKASFGKWLDELETTATPGQKADIEAFRQSTLLSLKDEAFIPPGAMSAIRNFLETQAKPIEMPPPEFIYLAPSDQQQALARWYGEQGVAPSPSDRPLWFRRPAPPAGNPAPGQDAAAGAANAASAGKRPPRTLQLQDESGNVITATMLGNGPNSPEQVYVPPADGPKARGDEPELMDKSHILYRDPETGEAYVLPWVRGGSQDHVPGSQGRPEGEAVPPQAMPARKAIEAAPPTTFSLQQVRNMRQPEKWKAGETYTRELNGSLGEAHFPVAANPDGPHPVFGEGGRYVDSPVFKSPDVIEAIEVKTYHRWTTINGVAQMREVPLTPKLQEQINKDVALRNENPAYQPRWVFLDAPPSAELQRALDDAGIVGNIFGHSKPATATPQSQPASSQVAAGRTIHLQDRNGEVIVAAMLGTEPRSPEQVYVPPSDGPRAPADAPEVQDKTHMLVYDPDTGEAVVLPWIRGASGGHGLTRDGVRATPLDQVPDLVMGDFQPNQVPWLKREQVAELTKQQFRDMDRAGLLPSLTKGQLRGIPKAKIGYVNIAGLEAKQVPWLTEGHVRNMTDQQFRDLCKAGLTPHLTKPQMRAIKGDMVEFVDASTLEARQVPWFKPSQVAKFTSEQFKDLATAGLLNNLTERQVPAIPENMIDSIDTAKLDPKQVPWLTEKQIPVLTRDQWGAFTIHHIEALTQPQIEAVTPKQFEEMSPGQFRKFTPEQFGWMGGDQTNGLSVLQLTNYRATHSKALTPDQAASVDLALSHARMRENAQALATFGGMSTTSYALWSSLPPTWSATAAAVAFGVRGFVFGSQAIFPNATANHKPFGRFLNALGGATFIAAAPGAATGMIQGKDLVVNSTFSLGNVVYGTKSMLQSFTGRPVIRNVAEHLAGPGYVLGCAVYTLHSWPAPIATVAGTLFTFGCAEFWASAIRTDRMNRRSVPRTDADMAAAEKSDKRWGAWDRWTLGITFGVGMLLFSLDSLLTKPWEGAPTSPPDPKKSDGDASSQQPDDPSDVPPQTPPEDFPQLVVSADDGLNLRTQPDGDSSVATVLQPGTFVEQTAKPSSDPSGEAWIPVEGFGPDSKMHSGWVSGDHVEVHPDGSSNAEGRTNPTLEKDGYQWVEVKSGDSIRLIARTHSADVAETVVLNMDHILSPDQIFSGDRIYLPVASVG